MTLILLHPQVRLDESIPWRAPCIVLRRLYASGRARLGQAGETQRHSCMAADRDRRASLWWQCDRALPAHRRTGHADSGECAVGKYIDGCRSTLSTCRLPADRPTLTCHTGWNADA